jgi:transposase
MNLLCEYGVGLVGPARPDNSWQAKAGQGFDISCFVIDWERQIVTYPQGHTSVGWYSHQDECAEPRIFVRFVRSDCLNCPSRAQCVYSQTRPRSLRFRPKEQHLALQKARRRQTTEEFKQACVRRAGVEGTISQGTRVFGLRRSRYIGPAKTHLQHVCTAVAINLMRLADWFDETPRAQTRRSRFAALAAAA